MMTVSSFHRLTQTSTDLNLQLWSTYLLFYLFCTDHFRQVTHTCQKMVLCSHPFTYIHVHDVICVNYECSFLKSIFTLYQHIKSQVLHHLHEKLGDTRFLES